MSSGPPNKRPRTDSGPTPLKSQLTRDVEFWFSDGSIILIAGNTLFRVYHGVLAAHSVVFHDMLQFPHPPSSPSLDGCPTLDLSDSPADLRHLLRVLYPKPATRFMRRSADAPVKFEHVSAIVRLSHKYQMDAILKDTMSYLTEYYSNYYHEWLARDKKPLQVKPLQCIEAVALAHLTGTNTILPTALLECAMSDGECLFKGYAREDGTVVMLSSDDIQRCFLGYRELKDLDAISIRTVARIVGEGEMRTGCVQPYTCRMVMHAFWGMVHSSATTDGDVLRPWAELLDKYKAPGDVGFCGACLAVLRGYPSLVSGRAGTWYKLPQIFGVVVPQWNAIS
ncbi:hypothetical protein TRAPUB_3394 [Trametes pubescens]|uniref:BTB domain-containing protein n=1 Tax=Trametes pubescens TaxID=154538 RepID=A0A1M2VDY1_TRAPU|nr:hypothetical protein TRAPUB_3394 [Trametes pubescens]